jgi:hypothetical protein
LYLLSGPLQESQSPSATPLWTQLLQCLFAHSDYTSCQRGVENAAKVLLKGNTWIYNKDSVESRGAAIVYEECSSV